jgi:hypothetical protein
VSHALYFNLARCRGSPEPIVTRSGSLLEKLIHAPEALGVRRTGPDDQALRWWLAPLFRQRYPRVRLDESRIIVQSNAVVTAGAALSHLDLALALIRRVSPELANLVARYLVVDLRTSQSIYSIPDHLANADPLIQQFERWARGRLAEGFSLDQAAEALATSKRTLARRMQSLLGKSPLAFFQDLRIVGGSAAACAKSAAACKGGEMETVLPNRPRITTVRANAPSWLRRLGGRRSFRL